ncbi:MAG: hypothetical protein AB2A00_13130 [Myxococcota bacterium]
MMRLLQACLKVIAVGGTALVLMATPMSGVEPQCQREHPAQTVWYATSTTCGLDTVLAVATRENECTVTINVPDRAGLPVSGSLGEPTDIREGGWTLEGPVVVPAGTRRGDAGPGEVVDGGQDAAHVEQTVTRDCITSKLSDGVLSIQCVQGASSGVVSGSDEDAACEGTLTEQRDGGV